jgi:hypothetical protein
MYLLDVIREALHVGYIGQFFIRTCVASPDFRICLLHPDFSLSELRANMLFQPEKVSLLTRVKEQSFSGAFLALVLLATAGWMYLLGSMFVRFVLWYFS